MPFIYKLTYVINLSLNNNINKTSTMPEAQVLSIRSNRSLIVANLPTKVLVMKTQLMVRPTDSTIFNQLIVSNYDKCK